MPKPITLRVGICSCSRRYRGQFDKLQLRAGGRHFRFKEVLIPEELQSTTIKKKRCHFFLDLHYDKDMQLPYLVNLVLENFCHFPHDRDIKTEIEWERNKPVPVPEVVEGIGCLLRGLRPKELKQWLMALAHPPRL